MMTFLRICCVLILTTFHIGIILIIILTFSAAQFLIELENLPQPPRHHSLALRPRSKSKPDGIFIHPTQSNIARADAAALELGLGGDTERVKGYLINKEESAWQAGTGRNQVRAMLAAQLKHPSTDLTEREPLLTGTNEDDSD